MPDTDHQGYVAGRYRDGLLSDGWTDAERCARGTFVAYVPRCSCGWVGADRPATQFGAAACRRSWFLGHVQAASAGPVAPRPVPARPGSVPSGRAAGPSRLAGLG